MKEKISVFRGWMSFKAFFVLIKREPDQFEEAKLIYLLKIEIGIKSGRTRLFLQINLSLNSPQSSSLESEVFKFGIKKCHKKIFLVSMILNKYFDFETERGKF